MAQANTYGNSRNGYNKGRGEVEYSVLEYLGVLERYQTGWTKEVNFISWNGGPGKIDIRDWNPDHDKMSRGVTLHEKEAIRLKSILDHRYDVDFDEATNFGVPAAQASDDFGRAPQGSAATGFGLADEENPFNTECESEECGSEESELEEESGGSDFEEEDEDSTEAADCDAECEEGTDEE